MAFVSATSSTSALSVSASAGAYARDSLPSSSSLCSSSFTPARLLPRRPVQSLPVRAPPPPAAVRMSSATANKGGPVRSTEADTVQKQFLERFKAFGRVRIIVRNPVGILETVGTFDSLFFATIPSGEYANLVDYDVNLDMHILLSGMIGARFETGRSRGSPSFPTYSVRLLAPNPNNPDSPDVAASVFLMWDKRADDVEQHRIDAWKQLKADFVKSDDADADTFYFDQL